MKKQVIIIAVLITLCGTSVAARRRSTVVVEQPEIPSVSSDVARLGGQYKDINMLLEKAKRDAATLQRQATREVHEILGRTTRRKSRIERRQEKALRRQEERKFYYEERAREQIEEVRKQSEKKARKIIEEAETRAIILKEQLEKQEAQDREKSRVPVTDKWRQEISREFAADTAFVKDIVMKGEASRFERENFADLFKGQAEWFDQTVSGTEYFFEESYRAAVAKRNALAVLVDAQRQADELIAQLVQEHHLTEKVSHQLRLLALYEINSHLRDTKNEQVFIEADVIRRLVDKVVQLVAPGQRSVTITTEKEQIEKLQARIAQLEAQVESVHRQASEQEQQTDVLAREQEQLVAEKDELAKHLQRATDETAKERAAQEAARMSVLVEKDQALAKKEREHEIAVSHVRDKERVRVASELEERETTLKAIQDEVAGKLSDEETLLEQLKQAQEDIEDLEEEVARLQEEQTSLKKQHLSEKQTLTLTTQDREREKTELEEALRGVERHISLLQQFHKKDVLAQINKQTKQRITQREMQRLLERKTREKVVLEVALAQVSAQLEAVRRQATSVIDSLNTKLSQRDKAYQDIRQRLIQKQKENVKLELAARQSEVYVRDAKTRVALERERIGAITVENRTLIARLQAGQQRVRHLRTELRERLEEKSVRIAELSLLVRKADAEMRVLKERIAERQYDIGRRAAVLGRMQESQRRLLRLRDVRPVDIARDAGQDQLFRRVHSFARRTTRDKKEIRELANEVRKQENAVRQLSVSPADELPPQEAMARAEQLDTIFDGMQSIAQRIPDETASPRVDDDEGLLSGPDQLIKEVDELLSEPDVNEEPESPLEEGYDVEGELVDNDAVVQEETTSDDDEESWSMDEIVGGLSDFAIASDDDEELGSLFS